MPHNADNFRIVEDERVVIALTQLFYQDVPPWPPDWGALMRAAYDDTGKRARNVYEVTAEGAARLAREASR